MKKAKPANKKPAKPVKAKPEQTLTEEQLEHVNGGAMNAYFDVVTEKIGTITGSVTQKGR
jgi:hypothetical protein